MDAIDFGSSAKIKMAATNAISTLWDQSVVCRVAMTVSSTTHAYIPITMITNGEDTNRSFVDIVTQRSILAFKYACVHTHHYDNKW